MIPSLVRSALVAALGLALLPSPASAQCTTCSPCGLNDGPLSATYNSIDWNFQYTLSSTNGDFFTQSQADLVLPIVSSNLQIMVDGYGFRTPWVSTLPTFDIVAYDSRNIGTFPYDCITLDSPSRRSSPEPRLRKTLQHEMFHAIQSNYQSDFGRAQNLALIPWWFAEGTARFMDDRCYTDCDAGTWTATFWDEVANDILPNPGLPIVNASYGAALFWSYCAEQIGGYPFEPGRGYPFVKKLWENVSTEGQAGNLDGIAIAHKTIRDMGGESFDALFKDYSLANLLYELDLSRFSADVQERYTYIDQLPAGLAGGPAYGSVRRTTASGALPITSSVAITGGYANAYVEYTYTGPLCNAVGIYAESDQPMAFAAVGRDGNLVHSLSKATGSSFARSFIVTSSNQIDRLNAVFTALENAVNIDYTIDAGPITGTILSPTFNVQAYPGVHDNPGPFLLKLHLDGPAGLTPAGIDNASVLGFDKDQFTVVVGTATGEVISASYVGGQYWLSVQAPTQVVDGAYAVEVQICDEQTKILQPLAVLYGDITTDHVLVIDNSGSMDSPDPTKLAAAKAGAKLYVDSVSTNDRIGVVSFSGNTIDCDDDGVDLAVGLGDANNFKKVVSKLAIDLIAPSNMTSIGDGLWKGQDLLDAAPPRTGLVIRTMCLLSDGVENEARYWDSPDCGPTTVRARLQATGTVVQAIALGPDSDQGLMQNISLLTGGDYNYVDVELGPSASARGPGAQASLQADSLYTGLARAYMQALAENRRLQRIAEDITPITETTTIVPLEVLDTSVHDALVHISWSAEAPPMNLLLLDPADQEITSVQADIVTSATHRVYHLKSPANQGTWRVVMETSEPFELYSGMLGSPSNAASMRLAVSQIHNGGSNQQREDATREGFAHGQPVTLLATLEDRFGSIGNTLVEAEVLKPDGTIACSPVRLYDDGQHHDGAAGDGVYGHLFTETSLASVRGLDRETDPRAVSPAAGSYQVTVTAVGEGNNGNKFNLLGQTSFHVYQRVENDQDKDGLPDTWELSYAPDLSTLFSKSDDTDEDGLTHELEYQLGTDPLRADTDRGGEMDGSEFQTGQCPLDPADDALPAPVSVRVVTEVGCGPDDLLQPLANLLQFPSSSRYDVIEIQRASAPTGPWTLLKQLDVSSSPQTLYYDTGLADGSTWYYRVRGATFEGQASPWSAVFQGTAKADPLPPKGWIRINHDSLRTDRTTLVITLDRSDDATHYRISDRPITGSERLLPLTNDIVTLSSRVLPGTSLLPAHVVYYDAASNASYRYSQLIEYDPDGNFDGTGDPNAIDPDDDDDGLSDDDELYVYFTDPYDNDCDGDGLLDAAEIGLTDPLLADTDGDGLDDATETAGPTDATNPDSDGDGLPDGWENDNGKDPAVADSGKDSDGDGLSDLQEYLAGTDPARGDSVLGLDRLPSPPGLLRVQLPTSRGRTYEIQAADSLLQPSWTAVTSFQATGRSSEFELDASSVSNRLYRIRLTP